MFRWQNILVVFCLVIGANVASTSAQSAFRHHGLILISSGSAWTFDDGTHIGIDY